MRRLLITLLLLSGGLARASYVLIPMDLSQKNHLKAYGIAFWVIKNGGEVDWLLNYRGGSFATKYIKNIENECTVRGVTAEVIADGQYTGILSEIANPEANMDVVKLEKAPKIAVYQPRSMQPWDDAVTMVLTYAEIPYDAIYDDEVLDDKLVKYDWLHLHQVADLEEIAKRRGFSKVSKLKLTVANKIKEFVGAGGFMFAMCSATDSYDIALDAANTDICDVMYDHDAQDPAAQQKLDYAQGFAFENYHLRTNPYEYEYSDIDANFGRTVQKDLDYFTLFDFSAKWDQVPTMLSQCHTKTIKGFMGQTTAFNKNYVKKNVLVMGQNKAANEDRYIHGEFGKGMWTFYGGHDPEDYQHFVGDPKTDLSLHPNSPGYRLILNNVLFPAARKKKQKT